MEFPKRAATHIAESASWKILQNALPAEWIIREVTERDYGVDCYVEIVGQNKQVTGNLCSIQLKSSKSIEWSAKTTKWGRKATFSGIKKETVNYWMNLPVPVFLMWAETSTGSIYFASVENQVRSRYEEYLDEKQRTFGFNFYSTFAMGSSEGEFLFFVQYLKERSFDQFSNYLTGLLMHSSEYYDFIVENQNLDCFLEVEEDRQLLMGHIYRTCKFLSQFIGIEWNVIGLAEAYRLDRDTWEEPCCMMHEQTLTRILRELEPVFIDILEGARQLAVSHQKDYWKRANWLLYAWCLNLKTDHMRGEF